MTDVFSRLMTSRPVDRASALAIAKSDGYTPNKKIVCAHADAPIWKMKPVPRSAPSLVGVVFGRLTVIGLADLPKGKSGARWIVRCVCGAYEHRLAKAIKNPNNSADACQQCRHVSYLKRTDRHRRGFDD